MKRLPHIIFIWLGFIFVQTTPTFACSGGPPPWDEWLPQLVEHSEVIVVGQYAELDDARANGIFHVEAYFKGMGSEFLVIQATDLRAIENGNNVHRAYNTCGRGGIRRPQISGKYLYFLTKQFDGSYKIIHERYFLDEHSTISISYGYPDIRGISIYEITDTISDIVKAEPQEPESNSMYPRVTPIMITTADERNYLLPLDSNMLVEISSETVSDLTRNQYQCDIPPCTVYSPNGMDKITLRVSADYMRSETWYPYVYSIVTGQRIIVSATSDTFALWKDGHIEIHALWYTDYGYPDDRIARWYSIEFVNSTLASNSLDYPVAWHPDGRELAFSTDEGLWLWDALTFNSEPRLLIPTKEAVPIVRYFSPQGRYIAVSEGESHYNLDLISSQQLPDGYVSPHDRTLLVFDTQAESPTTLEVMYLAPGIRRFEYYPDVSYLNVQWMNNTRFIASIKGFSYLDFEMGEPNFDENGEIVSYEAIPFVVEEPFYDIVQYDSSGIHWIESNKIVPYALQGIQASEFTYDSVLGLIEIGVDGYHIATHSGIISFESFLSEPIVNATWLPSIFYFEE